MSDLKLYFFPLSCARVTMVALEHVGATYDTELVNIVANEQNSTEYLSINSAGKVPALRVGDKFLTENVAIIGYLDQLYPDAGLLPVASDPLDAAMMRANLMWCSTTLHPILRQIRATRHYTNADQEPVKAKGVELLLPQFEALDRRFSAQQWWFDGSWSIMDTYLNWISAGYAIVGGDLAPYPALIAHGQRVTEQPAYRRMFEREGQLIEKTGVHLPPGVVRA